MRIRLIDFPEPLLNSLKDGKLVVFAGAGVSMGPPSNYPSFDGLTQDIENWAGLYREENEPHERFLGRLVHKDIKVHEKAIELLSRPESQPTSSHEYLVKLFKTADGIRIVTTNFDPHFETAAEKIYQVLPPVYRAPALPLGNDFSGIVYVHGSVKAEAKWIILTDQDFGRAYLTEAWASRFLRTMFSEYTVLFVGYSHDDTVMHYLSRGLPPEGTQPRYALVPEGANLDEWSYRGIEPVVYPRDEGNGHSLLPEGLQGWIEWSQRGALDTEKRIQELVGSPPPLDKESIDFLEWVISDISALRFFRRHAKLPEWINWVAERKALNPLFEFTAITDVTSEFIDWLCDEFVSVNDDDLFALIERKGREINPWFVFALARRLSYRDPIPSAESLSRWVPVIIEYGTYLDRHDLSEMLNRCLSLGADTAAILLFEFLTSPRLDFKKLLILPEEYKTEERKSDVELGFRGDYHLSHETWAKSIKPRLDDFAKKLWPGLIRNLHTSYQLLNTWEKAVPDGDPVSWHRSAIETHEQDQYPDDVDLLIDAARDCLDWALENDVSLAKAWIQALVVSESQILRRLAIYGITNDKSVMGNEKLIRVLEDDLFLTAGLKHEVFRLLSVAYPQSDQDIRVRFLDETFNKIDAQPLEEDEDQERNEYQKFNLLSWLSRFSPECDELKKRLTAIQNTHPKFEAREHPDLAHWMGGVREVGVSSPVSVEELLSKPPREWIDYFLEFQGDWFDGPNRDGMLTTIGEAVQKNFDWSKELIEILIQRELWSSDILGSIIRAWDKSTLDREQWDYVLYQLKDQNLLKEHPHSVSDLLQDCVKKEENIIVLEQFTSADELADMLWGVLNQEEQIDDNNWLGKAINRPGGKLAFFWLYALSKVCKQGDTCANGIPEPYRQRLDRIVTEQGAPAVLGRVVLASQIGFFFAIDPEWTKANLLPLLDWQADCNQARQAWDGWLSWGKWSEQLLVEIKLYYQQAFVHLDTELAEEKHQFIQHVIAIGLYWINNPIEEDWIPQFLRTVSAEDRVRFAQQMNSFLMNMKAETKVELWNRWLRGYLEGRNGGVPIQYTDRELVETVEWLPELGDVFDEAVNIVVAAQVPHFEHTSLFHSINRTDIPVQKPNALTRLLIHLTSGHGMQRIHCRDLTELTRRLIETDVDRERLLQLLDQLARIGCEGAGDLVQLLNG